MDKEEIVGKIGEAIGSVLGHTDFDLHDGLTATDVPGWDSLTHMEIITKVEKTFAVRFKLKEINKLKNLGSLVELVGSKIQA